MIINNPLNGGTFPFWDASADKGGAQPPSSQMNANAMELALTVKAFGQELKPQSGLEVGGDGKPWDKSADNMQLLIGFISDKLADELRTEPIGSQRQSFFDLSLTQRTEPYLAVYASPYVPESSTNRLTGNTGELVFGKEEYPRLYAVLSAWKSAAMFEKLRIFYGKNDDLTQRMSIAGVPESLGDRISLRYKIDNYSVRTGKMTPYIQRGGAFGGKFINEVVTETFAGLPVYDESGQLHQCLAGLIPDDSSYLFRNYLIEGSDYRQPSSTIAARQDGESLAEAANIMLNHTRLPLMFEHLYVKTNWAAYVSAVEYAEQLGLLNLAKDPETGAYINPDDFAAVQNASFSLWVEAVRAVKKRMKLPETMVL